MSPGAKIATLIIADLNDRKGMHINSLDEDVQSEILHIWTEIGDRIVGRAVTERLHAYDAQQANIEALNAELVKALEACAKVYKGDWTHGEYCNRTEECDSCDKPEECAAHSCDDDPVDECPECDCGVTDLTDAAQMIRAVLAKARGTT